MNNHLFILFFINRNHFNMNKHHFHSLIHYSNFADSTNSERKRKSSKYFNCELMTLGSYICGVAGSWTLKGVDDARLVLVHTIVKDLKNFHWRD